jgi:peroxiredoxin Q/BCP
MSELNIGDAVPSFKLPSDGGVDIDIQDLRGKNVVIYFYPKDDTPGCTIEAKDFTCKLDDFKTLNVEVLGISKDDLKRHEKFRNKYALEHILLSDVTGEVCEKFGCWVEKSMYGKKYMGIARKTFLIDKNGIIKKIWPAVKIDGHVDEVLQAIGEL